MKNLSLSVAATLVVTALLLTVSSPIGSALDRQDSAEAQRIHQLVQEIFPKVP